MRRLSQFVVLFLTLFTFHEQLGAQSRFNGQCRTDLGPISNGCVVTVYEAGTLTLADLFTNTGLSTPKANPFTADANGQLFFYAADANYDIVYTDGTPDVGTFTLADVVLGGGGGGLGSVTSVALSVPSFLSVAGSPITTSGTLAVTLATQADNLVFAGPASAGPAAPTFRSLVANDLPDIEDLNTSEDDGCLQVTSGVITTETCPTGTVSSIAMVLPGLFTVSGSPVTGSGTITVGLASQTQNQVFASPDGSAGAPGFRALAAGDIPSLDTAKITTGTFANARISSASVVQHEAALTLNNLLGTLGPTKGGTGLATYTTGDILYASATNTLAKLAGNTAATLMVLTQTGSGSASAAPAWQAIDADDLAAIDTQTFGTGGAASIVHTFDITAGTDPVWTYTSGFASLTTGTLRQGSTPVVLESRTISTTTPLAGGGALSSNLTLSINANGINAALIDETDPYVWTGYHNYSGGQIRLPESVIGSFPSAAGNTGKLFLATDAVNSQDCTVGGGSALNLCRSSGSAWIAVAPPPNQPDPTKQFIAAMCQGTTPAMAFNRAATAFPEALCVTGSNSIYGVLSFDDTTDELVHDRFRLPAQMPSAISLQIVWKSAATTGDVVWGLETACAAIGQTGDQAWNAAQTVTDTANGTTQQWNSATIASVTLTGCALDEEFFFRFRRDANNGADTLSGDADLVHLYFTLDLPAQP